MNPLTSDLTNDGTIRQLSVSLPTLGYFYGDNEVLRVNADPAEITVSPMSVLEENIFSDPMMMISGRGITKMISRITTEIIDPAHLCEIDIQAILIACRIVSHGSDLVIEHTCEKCKETNSLSIDLDNHLQHFLPFTPEELLSFDFEIPSIHHIVRLKPISYADAVELTIASINANTEVERFVDPNEENPIITEEFIEVYKNKFDKGVDINVNSVVSSIYSVTTIGGDVVTKYEYIHDWLLHLPPDDIKAITSHINDINKFINDRSLVDYKCNACGNDDKIYINLDPQKLFTPAEDQVAEKNSSAELPNQGKPIKKQSNILPA